MMLLLPNHPKNTNQNARTSYLAYHEEFQEGPVFYILHIFYRERFCIACYTHGRLDYANYYKTDHTLQVISRNAHL